MAEFKLELTRDGRITYPRLSRLEMEALIYVIRKLTRAWLLQGGVEDEC